jgi:hypothetical protein
MRLRLGLVTPVDVGIRHQLAKTQWNVNPRIAVAPAGLDQTQGDRGILRQARCQYASRRAPACNHHIELDVELLSQELTPSIAQRKAATLTDPAEVCRIFARVSPCGSHY